MLVAVLRRMVIDWDPLTMMEQHVIPLYDGNDGGNGELTAFSTLPAHNVEILKDRRSGATGDIRYNGANDTWFYYYAIDGDTKSQAGGVEQPAAVFRARRRGTPYLLKIFNISGCKYDPVP